MPRLIHLNGPPGIGKSTVAALYANRHPGVLNLDIDRLRPLIGGWRERFAETGMIVRRIALGMARTHLATGADVLLPQYLGRLPELRRFERTAHETGSEFHEILLTDHRERAIDRFYERSPDDCAPWHHQITRIVETDGGRESLAAMYDRLSDIVDARPNAVVVQSLPSEIDRTYDAVMAALA